MNRSASLLLTALSVLVAPLAGQADLQARQDAVKEFRRYFKKAKEEALMVEAIMTLEGNECAAAAETLCGLLTHKVAAVQETSLAVLGGYREQETFQGRIDGLADEKDVRRAAVTIKVLGLAKLRAAVPAIAAYVADARRLDGGVKYEAARALASIGDAGDGAMLKQFLEDAEPQVRMAACDAVAALKVAALKAEVTARLGDEAWQVQTAAIEAVAALRPQAAVQPLIGLMRESGRLRTECADALFRITALDFGVDPDKWQQQWDKLMAIDGWRIPTDEELAQKFASRKKYDAFYGKKEETNAFAGIPTTSTNVLFVIDVSGSMDDLVVEVDKFRGYKDRKRFTIVQTELLNTIDSLSAGTNFNIVAFASELHPWKKRLVPANVVNRDAARRFVERLKPIGGTEAQELARSGLGGSANLGAGKTNTLAALLFGFGIDPDKPKKKAAVTGYDKSAIKRPLDTIYFLSDGRPSIGALIEPMEIVQEVNKQNELFRIVIHAIAIGDFSKDFLAQLARDNGGVFVDLGR